MSGRKRFTAAQAADFVAQDENDDDIEGGNECLSEEEYIPPMFEEEEASSDDSISEFTSDSDSDDPATYRAKDGSIRKNQPPRPAAFRSSNIVRVTPGPT